jgi:hypothetical protein
MVTWDYSGETYFREHEISSLSDADEALSLLAGREAAELARIGDESERELGEHLT